MTVSCVIGVRDRGMRVSVAFALYLFNVLLFARPVFAQGGLSLDEVLERARARAPEVVTAFARVEEARARLLGASVRFRSNPVVETDLGPRNGTGNGRWDLSLGLGQTFETGGQRAARVAAATADVAHAAASADEIARAVTRDVASAFVRAQAAGERVRLLVAARTLAAELRAASERRYALGDIAAIDLNLTRIAAARAEAAVFQAEAQQMDALRPLRIALGLAAEAPVVLAGSLARAPAPRATLVAAIDLTPTIRATTAEIAEADAAVRLGNAVRHPDIGARMGVRREGNDRIVSGGVSFALPVFERGQATVAEAEARRRRLTLERDATRRVLELEVAAGLDAFERRRQAAEAIGQAAITAADDNETLATRSLDAGEISLMSVLLIRQDITATRLAYVDALAEAALASIDVDATAGVLR